MPNTPPSWSSSGNSAAGRDVLPRSPIPASCQCESGRRVAVVDRAAPRARARRASQSAGIRLCGDGAVARCRLRKQLRPVATPSAPTTQPRRRLRDSHGLQPVGLQEPAPGQRDLRRSRSRAERLVAESRRLRNRELAISGGATGRNRAAADSIVAGQTGGVSDRRARSAARERVRAPIQRTAKAASATSAMAAGMRTWRRSRGMNPVVRSDHRILAD